MGEGMKRAFAAARATRKPARRPAPAFTIHYGCRTAMQIPVRTVSEANGREHWAKKARRAKSQRDALRLAASSMMNKPPLPCTIRLTRIAPRALDTDNLATSFKACRDGLADWLGIDDRDPCVAWVYAQEKGLPREYAVRAELLP